MLRILKPHEETFRKDIIEKGPPSIRIVYETGKQKDTLPKKPFKIYDTNGNNCKLSFETEGIFIQYIANENGQQIQNERIFYPEIYKFKFTPTLGFEKFYSNLTLQTKFGKRILYFIPKEYTSLISDIIEYQ